MLRDCLEALEEKLSELEERLRAQRPDHLHILAQQLERDVLLQLDPFSWHVGQEKPEIDMNDKPVAIEQNVSIVPILDLEKVSDQAIPRE